MLALITASFPEGRERTRALGLFTAVAMGGASLGLVLGGVITQWATWRWVLFVNVPIGALVLALAPRFLPETPRQPGHFDLAGALSSTAGMSALVYAFIRAAAAGWQDRLTLAALAAALVLLGLFLLNEARAAQPITPLRLFAAPGRAGSYLARLLLVAGMFGMFFLLTQFVQDELGFSPLQAGLAFVPMTAMLFAVSTSASRLLARFAPKVLMVAGLVPVISGMAWLSQIAPGTHYVPGVLGPMLLLGAGHGRGVRAADHGLAGRGRAPRRGRRVQHGERHAAGRRLTGAGHPGQRVHLGQPRRRGRRHRRRLPGHQGRHRARHGRRLRHGGNLRHDRRADHPGLRRHLAPPPGPRRVLPPRARPQHRPRQRASRR